MPAVTYAKPFFDLQLQFAETVSALSGLPLDRAVLDYTNFYVRFGLGRGFDPAHPRWRHYVAGLAEAGDRGDFTYRFYVENPDAGAPEGLVGPFGCFAYVRLDAERIRLHFGNAEPDGLSPLGRDRREQRLADLRALFGHVRQTVDGAARVVGRSWLYNLPAYRRLFPEAYLATARVTPRWFRSMPLWGQFVDRHGEVREDAARRFRERLRRQTNLDGLDACFEFPVLSLEAPVHHFDDFYAKPTQDVTLEP